MNMCKCKCHATGTPHSTCHLCNVALTYDERDRYRVALEEIVKIGFSSLSKDYLICPLIAGKALESSEIKDKKNG